MASEPNVVLRDLATQNRQNVAYDEKTKNVQIGSVIYTPTQLQDVGGQLSGGRWILPQDSANKIIGGQSGWQSPQQQAQMGQMQSILKDMSNQYYDGQSAQLSSSRDSQIKELQSAYADAMYDGRSGIRDANSFYDGQASQINNQAYLDSEKTALYGNEMGVQNSQQMLGLMAGDNARKNSLMNQNMSERDKRISEINDRLSSINTKKNLDIANTNAQYDAGLLQAKSQSGQMYNNSMFGLMQDDYSSNRNQQNALNQLDYQDKITSSQMEHQDKIQRGQMGYQSQLAIEQMGKQHYFDMDTLAKSFENDLKKMQTQFGYSSSLQSQSARASANAASVAYQRKVNDAKSKYDIDLQRALNGITKGTPEYALIEGTKKREFQDNLKNAAASTMFDYKVSQITNDYTSVPKPSKKDFEYSKMVAGVTGESYNSKKYNKASNDYKKNPKVTSYNKMLNSIGVNDIFN